MRESPSHVPVAVPVPEAAQPHPRTQALAAGSRTWRKKGHTARNSGLEHTASTPWLLK
jgi:hypothetical protein